jgi:Tol biopolymer transport system component
MEGYSVSRDGKQVAFAMSDPSGHSSLWVALTDHSSSPKRISLAGTETEDSPFFLPDGDLIFRAIESGSNFLYRMKADGSGRRRISPQRIFDARAVSPDGRWVIACGGWKRDGFAVPGLLLHDLEHSWDRHISLLSVPI